MVEPLVSVVMPVYNNEKYVAEAIESILNQDYTNFEFIIIDDHSKDKSWEIIQEYAKKDERIITIRNEQNLKIPKTRNKAYRQAKGKYIVIQDGDDVSMPNRITKQVKFMEKNPDYAVLGSDMLVIDGDSKEIGKRSYESDYKKIKKMITRINPIPQPTVIIRKNIIDKIGYYNEEYVRCSDYDLWIRAAKEYKISILNQYLVKYRRSDDHGLVKNYDQSLKYTLIIQRKNLLKKDFFNPINVLYWIFKLPLIILPKKMVLFILDKFFYRSD